MRFLQHSFASLTLITCSSFYTSPARAQLRLSGAGSFTCETFQKKAAEVRTIRERVAADRKALVPLAGLTDEQNQQFSKTRDQLLQIQDAIDHWFETSFEEYGLGVVQNGLNQYVDRKNYAELIERLGAYRFAFEYAEFCENPKAKNETFHRYAVEIQKSLIRILNEAPKLER